MSVHRCPWCDCLLDRSWSTSHAPSCPARHPAPELLLASVRALRSDLRQVHVVFTAPYPVPITPVTDQRPRCLPESSPRGSGTSNPNGDRPC